MSIMCESCGKNHAAIGVTLQSVLDDDGPGTFFVCSSCLSEPAA